MTTANDALTLEPRTRQELGVQVLSSLALGVAYLVFVGAPCLAAVLAYWIADWWVALSLGLVASSVMVSCGFVVARLTRDDRKIGVRLARGDAALTLVASLTVERDNWKKLAEGAQPVSPLPVRDDAKFVAPKVRDAAWSDARMLLTLVQGDYGKLPGRTSSGMTQAAQEAAVHLLVNAGVLRRKGNQYELGVTRAEATARLDAVP